MQQDYTRFEELNAEILAISVEGPDMAQYVSDLFDLQYPVLSDANHSVVEQYGVFNLLGDSLATPAVFLVDLGGVIRWGYVGESSGDRPPNETILEQLGQLVPAE